MSGAGYDVVVDVDDEVCQFPTLSTRAQAWHSSTSLQGDLGHTDLQEDLEFHPSNFTDSSSTARKLPGTSSGLPPPATNGSGSSKRFLWTLSFYAQFFDVDTNSVLSRCWAALYPRANFLDVLEGNPDLYGPFWIATTVVFILFLGGTISQYLSRTGSEHFAYDFTLLSGMLLLIWYLAVLNILIRCCWPHLWLYSRDPYPPLRCPQIFWQRIRQPPRMLGIVRLLKSHLDSCRVHILVTYHNS